MPARENSQYNLSFTAASLRPELCRILAELFLETGDWVEAKRRAIETNALQAKSPSTAVRLERELRQRLQTLTHEQIALLASSTADDRSAMSWLAALKHNTFLFELAAELLRDKLAAHEAVLRRSDYERFIEVKEIFHPELRELTTTSRTKVRNVSLRMLIECGLLVEGDSLGTIQRPVLSPDAQRAIREDDPRWLAGFLVPDSEIRKS